MIKKGTLQSIGMYNKNASNMIPNYYWIYISAQQIDKPPQNKSNYGGLVSIIFGLS